MVDNPSKDYRENADDCRAQAAETSPERKRHGSTT